MLIVEGNSRPILKNIISANFAIRIVSKQLDSLYKNYIMFFIDIVVHIIIEI